MRVSNKQMLNSVTRSVATTSEQLLKLQQRAASMKMINRPSDDPSGMNKVLDYRTKIASVDQYLRNIESAKTRVEATVTNLETVYDLLNDAKEIAIGQTAGGDGSGRETAATQIGNIYDQIRDIANTRIGGSYIFAGHQTDTMPFPKNKVITEAASELSGGEYFNISSDTDDYYVWYNIDGGSDDPKDDNPSLGTLSAVEVPISSTDTADQVAAATQAAIDALADFDATVSGDEVTITLASNGDGVEITDMNTQFDLYNTTYNGDSGALNTIVGEGAALKTNAHGNETFTGSGVTGGVDVLGVLETLKEALEDSSYDPVIVDNQVGEINKAVSQVESMAANQSVAYSRLEKTEDYLGNLKLTFETTLSATEDADSAEVAVELQAQETAYEMALASAAAVLEMNILDFLR
ncbi:MAG: flagellar hook-associated protein FlgL [Deltaproteobacteria bacterium]|nr:flagellar hook-associated protein FlgL [Deltaproteobacteria bacterium]